MDHGIPTEETLEKMRSRGIEYLVGTPKGRLTHVEKPLPEQPWTQARESVRVKILLQESEFYVYVESHDRVAKERSMRRRRFKRLWTGLHEPVNGNTFCFKLDRERLLRAMSREGRYLLRSNMKAASPETALEFYLLLTRVERLKPF